MIDFDINKSSTDNRNNEYCQKIKIGASKNFLKHFGGNVGEKANFHWSFDLIFHPTTNLETKIFLKS